MSFLNYLEDNVKLIEKTIEIILAREQENVLRLSTKLTPLISSFIESSEGGKRLRGVLVRLGYEMVADKFNEEVLKAAAAIEIFQTAILAHDDIIDLSPLRRGRPTLYRRLGGDHYGVSQTICLGDVGLFLGNKIIADCDFPDDRKNQAISNFSDMVLSTIYGEMLDVELPHSAETPVEADVMAIHRLKTAYYTVVYPLMIGVILAGGDKRLLKKITYFGENLGIAFQIQDDILGVFGDEKTMGKSVTSDIEEGKNTTLITRALEKADDKQRKILDRYYGTGKVTTQQMEKVKQVFIDTGALDYSRQLAVQYVSRAKETINQLTDKKEYQQLLDEMADFLVERTK